MFLRAQHVFVFLRDAHSVFTEIVLNKSSAASKRQAQCVAIRPTNRLRTPSSLSPMRKPSQEPPSWFQVTSVESELQNSKASCLSTVASD